jgi:hypothetical protein
MWDGALKCLLWFLLRSEVTKGLNFILAAAAPAMVAKGKRSACCFRFCPPVYFYEARFSSCTLTKRGQYSVLIVAVDMTIQTTCLIKMKIDLPLFTLFLENIIYADV